MIEIVQIDQSVDNQIDNIVDASSAIELPSSPKIINIIPGTGQLTVFFEPPPIGGQFNNYQYSPNGGMGWASRIPASTSSPLIITGLSDSTCLVTIRAVNNAGIGKRSSIIAATPFAAPVVPQPTIAPLIFNSSLGDQEVTLFIVDQNPTGAKFTNLEYSLDNGANWTTSNPAVINNLTITGLTNGVTYQIKVRGTNDGGTSPASLTVSLTPASLPSAPIITNITPGQNQLTVTFTAPTSDGGNPISEYEYSTNNGTTWISEAFPPITSSPITIANLTIGTTYQVVVRAKNAIGYSPSSNMLTGTPVPGVPTAPTITSITPDNGTLSVTFTAPASNGGATITNYEYSTNNGSTWVARNPASVNSPLVISGLTNGTSYQVRIRAVNSSGAGTQSSSVSGTPILVEAPSAPTITSITPGDGQLSVAFTAPASNGNGVITNYEYSTNNGSTWTARSPSATTSPLIISELTNTTSYQVRIRAVNSAGAGTQSNAVSGTPIGAPSAPTITDITSGNGTLSVAFTAPASNGGGTITNYEYSTNNGSTWTARNPADITSPLLILGLVNETSYQVRIRAVNNSGAGTQSNAVSGTPSGTSITLTINSNGSLIESYTTNTVTVSYGGYYDESGFNPEFVGGSTVTSLTFSSCGYYSFVINETSTLTNLTNLSFDQCGNYGFGIYDTDFFRNLTTIYFGNYLGSEGGGFNIIDNTTILPEAKALLVLNAILNRAQNGIIGRGTITLKVTGASTLQTVRNSLISQGFIVNLVT